MIKFVAKIVVARLPPFSYDFAAFLPRKFLRLRSHFAARRTVSASMARRKKDSKLDTRTARTSLTIRNEPYWCAMSGGLSLGYRKGKRGGHWIAKQYSAQHGRRYFAIGHADDSIDVADADCETGVFTFDQAQEKAREWLTNAQRNGQAPRGPYLVDHALDDYLEFLRGDGRDEDAIKYARYTINAHMRSQLGGFEVMKLTIQQLRKWHADLAKAAPRVRTRSKQNQKHRKVARTEPAQKARKASANRILTTLKAALNRAFDEVDAITSNKAWGRALKPFKGVSEARDKYLQIAAAKRLVNAADPDFRKMIQGGLQSGARYGQLAQLIVSDFNPDAGTLRLRSRKGDGSEKTFFCTLTDEGLEFFREQCAGLASDELIFRKADGSQWGKSHQRRPMADACKRANIKPALGFHGLRHTWASHSIMNGVPLMVVAKNLGHSDTRMVEKHYGHLAPSFAKDAIRAGAPKFDFEPETNIVVLAG